MCVCVGMRVASCFLSATPHVTAGRLALHSDSFAVLLCCHVCPGWPSFYAPIDKDHVIEVVDKSIPWMPRVEVIDAKR